MIQRVTNTLLITCEDVDFTTSTNIEFYMQQGSTFKSYNPTVVDEHTMTVLFPKADMLGITNSYVELQFALTDSTGSPVVSDVIIVPVAELLKEAGYGA